MLLNEVQAMHMMKLQQLSSFSLVAMLVICAFLSVKVHFYYSLSQDSLSGARKKKLALLLWGYYTAVFSAFHLIFLILMGIDSDDYSSSLIPRLVIAGCLFCSLQIYQKMRLLFTFAHPHSTPVRQRYKWL